MVIVGVGSEVRGPGRHVAIPGEGGCRLPIAWRDHPEVFGPWKTVRKRHHRFAEDSAWDGLLRVLVAEADSRGIVDWTVSVDSTINRAHQHATNTTRDTEGSAGLHESGHRAAPHT